MARKPGRPKLGAEVLNRERIITVALQLVDEDGVDALTMRRLARVLGVDPMAIYRHVPDKAALIAGIVERVFGEFKVPVVAGDDWQAQVRAFATAYRALILAHPNLMVYMVTHVEVSPPAVLAVNEALAAKLLEAGLAPLQVVIAINTIVDYLHGLVLGESGAHTGQTNIFSDFYTLLDTLPAGQYPAMRATYGTLDAASMQAHLADGIELILAGIAAWLEA